MKKGSNGTGRIFAVVMGCLFVTAASANAQCPQCVGDANGNGTVTIDELVQAVNNALEGCPGAATATRTPTRTATNVPTVTPTPTVALACAVTPGAWSAPNWATNAAESLALRAQLATLTGASTMRGAEQGTVVLGGVQHLIDVYEAGNPSLADITTPTFDAIVDDAFEEFVALIAAGTFDPIDAEGRWTPGPAGGIFGTSTRGFNAGGLEIRQFLDKGLFAGASLYSYAAGLTTGAIDPGTIDALAAAWGANELLDPAGALTQSASYSRQMGFHARMAAALTNAKAYAGDGACVAQRDDAIRSFFRLWEQSMLARTVYYANLGKTLSAAATTDNQQFDALHQIGEGGGLALGFRGVVDPTTGPLAGAGKIITDSEIDEILVALRFNRNDLNASTTGLFIEDESAFAAAVLAVEQVVAEVYGLDAAEIALYRAPVAG